ncbi:MAG: TonB-dependent receptor [Bacteroidales bacterium]|nr:TonB-dependent receptor [Bacteroidales bacterium]
MRRVKSITLVIVCLLFQWSLAALPVVSGAEAAAPEQVSQAGPIRGSVVDASGEPVIGAGVRVLGTDSGAVTDLDGVFVLDVAPGARLEISCIGYATQTVEAANGMRIVLSEDTSFLDEVVVVGYGTQRKSEITGSMARMTSEMIEERPVQNALQAMQGRVTGMDVSSNNRPGEIGSITIRGNRSLNASNSPLYVVDGIPYSAGSINDLNPQDIESVEVLKDASATAIYGSRGANGVLLVTTKRGKTGKTSVNYSGTVTLTQQHSLTKWMNSEQLLDYNRQQAINSDAYGGQYGTAPDPDQDIATWLNPQFASYMDASLAKVFPKDGSGNYLMRSATAEEQARGYASMVPEYHPENLLNTDWGSLVLRHPAVSNDHVVSLSAGTDKSNVYVSMGMLDQQVPMKDQMYRRYTAKVSGEVTATPWLKAGLGMNGTYSEKDYGFINNTGNEGLWKDSYSLAVYKMMPWTPAYNDDGSILTVDNEYDQVYHSPLRNMEQSTNMTYVASVNLSSFAELDFGGMWSPLKGLRWRTNFGFQYRHTRSGQYNDSGFTNPFSAPASLPNSGYYAHNMNKAWTLENMLMYNRDFGNIHSLGITLVQSAEVSQSEGLNARMYDTVYPTAIWFGIGDSDKSKLGVGASYSGWQRSSYMGRVNYSLMSKYLLTATIRYDGASVLAPGHKWDYFPSMALAWKMEQEEFIKRLTWINQLKLRAGYGVTGNSAISPYKAMGTITSSRAKMPLGEGLVQSNTPGAKPRDMANYELGWEKTASLNIGLDYAFLDYRIYGSLEYYVTNTYDLLMNQSVPVITGYTTVQANVGKTRNRGFEIELNTVNVKTHDFQWETNWTFSTNHDEIVELANGATEDKSKNWFVGAPVHVVYTWQYDRLWQDTPADNRLMDIYRSLGQNFYPGTYKTVDQEFIETTASDPEAKSVQIKNAAGELTGETVYYKNNGFGVFDDNDKALYSRSPKWVGGINNTFTWKDLSLSIFAYFRFGNAYGTDHFGTLQTIGRRVENDTWSPTNTGARYALPIDTSKKPVTVLGTPNMVNGDMVAIRNISLYYNLPKAWINKIGASNASVSLQVLNPFVFGGELVRVGINPDDMNSDGLGYLQTNNTTLNRSLVFGLRIGF